MRHRPAAGGISGYMMIGLLSLFLAVLVGVVGGVLSLLLRWPGLEQAGPFLRMAAEAHVPILIFYAALPASLGGLAVALLPGQVGADRSAFPRVDLAAFGLTIVSLVALVVSALEPAIGRAGVVASANLLALATVLTSASLIATTLLERTVPYSALPTFARMTLIAAALALCAAPITAAAFTVALPRGGAANASNTGVLWPALCVVMVLMLGLVTDILVGRTNRHRLASAIPILLGGGMLVFFMVWASCLENRIAFSPPTAVLDAFFLLLILPVELFWWVTLVRASGEHRPGRLPFLFAAGFAVMLPVGLFAGLLGSVGHEAISLAVVFGLFAGFFRLTVGQPRHGLTMMSGQLQFWLLLAGSLTLLLPLPQSLKVLGAAMSSLSIGLFVVHLVAILVRSVLTDRDQAHAALAGPLPQFEGRRP